MNWIGGTVSDMATQNYTRRLMAEILDLVQPEIAPFDPLTSKTLPRTKQEVDWMTRCRDMAVRNFPKCEVGRQSLVSCWSVLNIYNDLMYSSLHYERSARRVKIVKLVVCRTWLCRSVMYWRHHQAQRLLQGRSLP